MKININYNQNNYFMENQSQFETFELQLTEQSKMFLKETGKWAYFLSILGFVFIGLIVIMALFLGTTLASLGGGLGGSSGVASGLITFVYLIMAALYFMPVYYLFKFGSNIKSAFADNDTERLTSSLEYLKSHYKFVGILVIVILSFYALVFVLAMVGGLASMF